MDKQSNLKENLLPENKAQLIENFKNEVLSCSVDDLKKLQMKLNYLCMEIDPYNCLDLSVEEENILNDFSLKFFLENPFDFTNIILKMLDLIETEIKKRLQ